MCSLFGWLDYKDIVGTKVLTKLTQSLAVAAEERGTDATGISYVNEGRVVIYKRPKAAHKLNLRIPEGTRAVMGHTRLATQGSEKKNFNNHPFGGFADVPFAFAHNGVIWNYDSLHKTEKLPRTNIETDSYVAVQLIEKIGKLDPSGLIYASEKVSGTFNFSVLDKYNNLYLVKNNNPLTILHFEALGLFVYASTESILSKALKNSVLRKFEVKKLVILAGEIFKISRKGRITKYNFMPKEDDYSYLTYGYNKWYFNDFDELDELSYFIDYYGVDAEDVNELLEYGYTLDDVYDLMANKKAFNTAIRYIRGEVDDTEGIHGDNSIYRQTD